MVARGRELHTRWPPVSGGPPLNLWEKSARFISRARLIFMVVLLVSLTDNCEYVIPRTDSYRYDAAQTTISFDFIYGILELPW